MNIGIQEISPLAAAKNRNEPPALPENWYILATSGEIAPGKIVCRELADREIVLYRPESGGSVRAFAAHCAHMGCHLKHGKVIGDGLRCDLHFRHIDPEGRFVGSDGAPMPGLVQPGYAVEERYGVVFVHAGETPRFGLPEPDLVPPDHCVMLPAGEFLMPNRWFLLVVNGFDMEHLRAVHHRELVEEPVMSAPHAHAFRIAYHTRITGKTMADRLLKRLSGDSIRASMTCVGGTSVLVQSQATVWRSLLLLSFCPTKEGGTLVRAVVGIEKSGSVLDRIRLRVAQWLFRAFLAKDLLIFDRLEWIPPRQPHTFGDHCMIRFYGFLAALKPVLP